MVGERDKDSMPNTPDIDTSSYFGEDSFFDDAPTPPAGSGEGTPIPRTGPRRRTPIRGRRPTPPEVRSGPEPGPSVPPAPEPPLEPTYSQISDQVSRLQRHLAAVPAGTPEHTQIQNRLDEFSQLKQNLIDQARQLDLLDEVDRIVANARNTIQTLPGVTTIAREYADDIYNPETETDLVPELKGLRRAYLEEQLQEIESDRQRQIETERVTREATEATERAREEESRRVEEARRQPAAANREQEYRQFSRIILDNSLPTEVRNEAVFKATQIVEQFLRPTAGGITETMPEPYDKSTYGVLMSAIQTGFEDPQLDAIRTKLQKRLEARFNYHNLWVAEKRQDEAAFGELFLSMHSGNHDYIQNIRGIREFQYALRQDNGAFFRSEGGRNIDINDDSSLSVVEQRLRQQIRNQSRNRLNTALSSITSSPLPSIQALTVAGFDSLVNSLNDEQIDEYNEIFDQIGPVDTRIQHEIWLLRQKVRVAELFQGRGVEEDPLDGSQLSSEGTSRFLLELAFVDDDPVLFLDDNVAQTLAQLSGRSVQDIRDLNRQDLQQMIDTLNPDDRRLYHQSLQDNFGLSPDNLDDLFSSPEQKEAIGKLQTDVERRFVIAQMNYRFTGLAARYDGPRWSREHQDTTLAGKLIELPVTLDTDVRGLIGNNIVIDLTHPPVSSAEGKVMIADINNDPYLTSAEKQTQIDAINADLNDIDRREQRVQLQWFRKNKPELISQAQNSAWRNFFRDHYNEIDFTTSCSGAGADGLGRLIYNPVWREKQPGQVRGVGDELRQYTSLQIHDFLLLDGYSSLIDMNANFESDFIKRKTYVAKFGMAKKMEGVVTDLLSDVTAINDPGFEVIKKLMEPQAGLLNGDESKEFSSYWVEGLVRFRRRFNELRFSHLNYRNISSVQAEHQIDSSEQLGFSTRDQRRAVLSEVLNPWERTVGVNIGSLNLGGAIMAVIGKFLSLVIGGK